MFRRRRRRSSGCLGPLILALLMGGLAFYIIPPSSPNLSSGRRGTNSQSTSTAPVASRYEEVLLAVPVPNGRSDRLFRVSLADGKKEEQIVEQGWRLDASRMKIQSIEKKEDIFVLVGGDWNVPLRAKDGTAYENARLEGEADQTHVWVTALDDDPVLLLVSVAGEIREAYRPPEMSRFLGVSESLAWYATFTPGEGLESPASGPSDLVRVTPDAMAQNAARDEAVISEAIGGPQGAFAYRTEGGDAVARSGTDTWRGSARPFVWVNDHELLLGRGVEVLRLNLATAELLTVTSLPAAPARGWLDGAKAAL